ncbi:MAG: response regulator [Candidatus Margulisbacteria bacterium]|jgi:CheY-like chemotaxis protein|nr:response regulator [Candidatus Margulisiibacteriota bacterium]
MKILIADDETEIRTALETIVRSAGHQTVLALDGAEALEQLSRGAFDLALLDISMPKVDGYETLKQIRAAGNKMPVVFITGSGESKKVAQSIAQDRLNGFIEKPFTPEKVLEIVSKTLVKRAEL